MKFLSIAVAALALAGMTEAKKSISAKQLKTRMSKGEFNKQTLMRGAKPYNQAARKLEEGQGEGEEEEWAISGLYSVQFSSCLSLTMQAEDLFSDSFISYAQEGELIAEKSFIVFSVCETSDCYYQGDDEKMTYITDLATYLQAFADFLPNQVENYCNACQEQADYCSGALEQEYAEAQEQEAQEENGGDEENGEEENGEDEGGEDEGEGGEDEGGEDEGEDGGDRRRKLSKVMQLPFRKLENNQVVQMIDCDMCNAYECFADEAEDDEAAEGDDAAVVYEFEDALEWLNGLSQCQQMEDATINDMSVYAGLICNAAGTGVEIGVFLDEDCTLYSAKNSYASLMSYADQQYYSMSEEVVEYMFTNDFSCYQPEIEYTNPYDYQDAEDQGDGNDENAEEDEVPEAAEWCENLFNGNMEATSLYDCGADDNAEENGDDQNDDAADENLDLYDWYNYQLSEEQADDASEICEVIKALDGEYSSLYDKKNGGTMYSYQKNWGSNNNGGMGTGGVVMIVLLVVVVSAGVASFLFKSKKGGDKRDPLISNDDGQMA